jgi:hypothetical protein
VAEAERRAETLVGSLNGLTLGHVLDPSFELELHARSLKRHAVEAT